MGINLIKPNIPPNIERINKHLYGVRFSWVRVGWVKAFPFLLEDNAKHAFVTGNGEIVLNMDDPDLYQLMLSTLVERVMPRKDKTINAQIAAMEGVKNAPGWDNYHEMLLFLLKLKRARRERKRRR